MVGGADRRGSSRTTAVTQGLHVRAILFDPCAYLISSADGSVTGDKDLDVVRHALEQPQRSEVVLDRVCGVQVEERNQDIRKHVAGDENAALLDEQRRMASSMPLMLDNPNLWAIPGNLRSFGGQAGNLAKQSSSGISSPMSGGNTSATWAFQSACDSRSLISAAQRAVP